ncbi:MAG: hypothetical protein V4436_02245 [Patescibacteria group bacterium]
MQYTEQQLMDMPMKFLKQLDIQNVEEEQMVQRVLNTRLKDMPAPNPLNFSASATDNMTIEKEQAMQAKIDERNARLKAQLAPTEEEIVTEPQPLPNPTEPEPEVIPTANPIVEPVTPPPAAVLKTKFCDYCDSAGGRHKLVCTRPGKPIIV